MSTVNMAELFKEAEAEGLDVSPDLPRGAHTVRIKSSGVKALTGKSQGERLYFVLEAVDGSGTIVHGQNFTPDNKKSLFFWFRFLAQYGVTKDFYAANPTATPEAIGRFIADQGKMYTAEVKAQKNNPQYNEIEVSPAEASPVSSPPQEAAPPSGDKEPWE